MPLPKQIQDQIAAAEQLELALNAPAEAQVPGTPAEPPQVAEPPAPTPDPTPAPVPTPQPVEDQKYKVLKGKYDSEVPALHAQNRELNARVAQLTAQVQAVLQAQQTPAPTAQPQVDASANAKDISDFGQDMIEMVQRVVHSVHASMAGRFDNEISKLRTEIATLTGKHQLTASQQFDKDLKDAVPDWEAVDATPEWLQWLGQPDPFTGIVRQNLLTDAHQNLDVRRVAAIFNAYKQTLPAASHAIEPPTPPAVTSKSDLEKQVAPSKASAAATPANPATQEIWTDASIQNFYKDQALGKFRGREAEMNKIEADLNAAIAEGRYRPR